MHEIVVASTSGDRAETRRGEATVVVGSDVAHLAPTDTLLSALGSCSAMTLHLYAGRKGWPLESVSIRLTHEQENPQSAHRIEQHLTLIGDLDDEQRERLRVIAGRCPVHRILEGPIEFGETLVSEAVRS